MAERYLIQSRSKEMEVAQPSHDDFTLGEGRAMTAADLVNEPGWSPYAFDGETILFTRLADTDLANAPFVYMSQFQDAQEVAIISLAEFLPLTEADEIPDTVMIFSIGRCGTTLANHILNASPDIWCLSEPDVIDHVAMKGGDMAAPLIQGLVKYLHKTRSKQEAKALGIKFRSQSLFCADVITTALPDARNIFMYRDALGWSNSFYAFAAKLGAPVPYGPDVVELVWEIMVREPVADAIANHPELQGDVVEPSAMLALIWQRHLVTYQAMCKNGIKFAPLRYNEFNSDKEQGVKDLFAACQLPEISADDALKAFGTDSQKGTIMAREEKPARLDADQIEHLHKTLANNPPIESADYILE